MKINREVLKKIITDGFLDGDQLLTVLRFLAYQISVDELKARFKEEKIELEIGFDIKPEQRPKSFADNIFLNTQRRTIVVSQPCADESPSTRSGMVIFTIDSYDLITSWSRETIHNNDPMISGTFVSYGAYLDHLVVSTFERNTEVIRDILRGGR